MITIKDFIKCYPNILDNTLCDDIINSYDFDKEERATINEKEVSDIRKVYQHRLHEKFDTIIFNKVGEIIKKYHKEFPWFPAHTLKDTGYVHLCYKGGDNGEYKMHIDSDHFIRRMLSISFTLNENYNGGDFLFFDEKYKIEKKKGMAVVFPSNFCFPHAVTPVTNGDRHSIITWIH